ncbi:hypothetical protein SAMD00019534_107560, partial [Acytostelium subglobosum LB1]|uniref:hypothetical protein n=1 Tax=Acytostelium subglobosum LB1 TaxID=1410327 RepID=UPI000644A864
GSSIVNGLNPLADPLALFIVQLLLIVILSKLLAWVLSYLYQPPVISEVITGIILGPSVLGNSLAFKNNVFPASSLTTLNVIANIGLILFMFMIGLEVDPKLLKNNAKMSIIISLSSIILPFAMGVGLAAVLWNQLGATSPDISFGLFCVFVGVAISITAFPVLARILTERGLMQSKVGATSLAAASVDDVIAWILLAFVVSFANNIKNTGPQGIADKLGALWTFILLIGYFVFMMFPVRLTLIYIYRRFVKNEAQKHNFVVFLLMLMFMSAFYTEVIGVHAIFGAFVLGVVTPRIDALHLTIVERIQDVVTIILLPLYFTNSGLKTSLSSINSGVAGGCTILIIVVACIGKIGGATFAARYCNNTWRESITVGFLMNTKGLVELIVLNIGLQIGVLNQQTFTMFVVMALVTTFMTTPVVNFIYTRWVEKQSRMPMIPRQSGKFDMLLYPSNPRQGQAMTMVAGSIVSVTKPKKYKVRSVYATESSGDRPSTYFFHNVSSLPPLQREVYQSVQSQSAIVGVSVKPVVMSSTDISTDICHIAKNAWPDLVLMGYTPENADLTVSMNLRGDSFYGRTIQKVLQNVRSAIGVVVDKGLDRFNKNHHILFSYTGAAYETDAITVLFKMARRNNINVTIITNHIDEVRNKIKESKKLDMERFLLIQSEDPHREIVERSTKEELEYWLVIVGVAREDAFRQEKLINTSTFSLLLVHPANSLLEQGGLPMERSISTINVPDISDVQKDHAIELPDYNKSN